MNNFAFTGTFLSPFKLEFSGSLAALATFPPNPSTSLLTDLSVSTPPDQRYFCNFKKKIATF